MLIRSLRQFYAEHYEWALRFPVVHQIRMQEARLLRRLLANELDKSDSALEVGAGTGYYTFDISQRVARLVALEKSPEMAAVLLKRIARAGISNVRIVPDDFFAYKPEKCFDHVLAFGVLDHIPNWSEFLNRCVNLAARRVIVTMPHRGLWNRLYAPLAILGGIRVYAHSTAEVRSCLNGRLIHTEDVGLRTRYTAGFTLVVVVHCGGRVAAPSSAFGSLTPMESQAS